MSQDPSGLQNQLPQDTTPPASSCQQSPHKAGTGNQPNSSQPHLIHHPQWSNNHNRRTHEAHIGAPLEHRALVTRGECVPGMHRTSLTKCHFYKVGKHNKSRKYIEIKIANWAKRDDRETCFKQQNKI